jgi:hypothetical protein
MTHERGTTSPPARPVVAIVENLLDAVPITETARRLGVQVVVASPAEADATCRREKPRLILLDLTAGGAVSLLRLPALQGIPTVGFHPHVRIDLRQSALEAGLDRAIPRSAFFDRLPEVLRDPSGVPDPGSG